MAALPEQAGGTLRSIDDTDGLAGLETMYIRGGE